MYQRLLRTRCWVLPVLVGSMGMASSADASIYADFSFEPNELTDMWTAGIGYDAPHSFWGAELNTGMSQAYNEKYSEISHSYVTASLTARWEHVLLEELTLKGGVGMGFLYKNTQTPYFGNNETVTRIVSHVQLSYRLTDLLDVYLGYRFFNDANDFPVNGINLGARLYWERSETPVTLFNDTQVTRDVALLRQGVIDSSRETQAFIDGYGLTPTNSEFFVADPENNSLWEQIILQVDDEPEVVVPLVKQYGIKSLRLPKGEHTLRVRLLGKDAEGRERSLEAHRSLILYGTQGLSFLLSVKTTLFGSAVNVQVN